MDQSNQLAEKQRLPRSDIPPDLACPYPDCGFQAKIELQFRGHMSAAHGVLYERSAPSPVKQALAKYNKTQAELEALTELKPWHRVALARHTVYGQPFSEVAKEMKHSAETLRSVAKSPAGKAFIAAVEAELSDPAKFVKGMMVSDTAEMYMMWLQARDWAYDAKDYATLHKMAKEIGLQPVLEEAQKTGPTRIVLNLNVDHLDVPDAKTSFRVVEDAEFVVEDPDE